jgi:hypothetical protein
MAKREKYCKQSTCLHSSVLDNLESLVVVALSGGPDEVDLLLGGYKKILANDGNAANGRALRAQSVEAQSVEAQSVEAQSV